MPQTIYKNCFTCKQSKPIDFFSKDKSTKTGRTSKCKDCALKWRQQNRKKLRENGLAYSANNKEKIRNRTLKYRYGIDILRYEELCIEQDNKCAICGNPPNNKKLHVDHNHENNMVRGLLCYHCNVSLGSYETWFNKYEKMILQYILKYKNEGV